MLVCVRVCVFGVEFSLLMLLTYSSIYISRGLVSSCAKGFTMVGKTAIQRNTVVSRHTSSMKLACTHHC